MINKNTVVVKRCENRTYSRKHDLEIRVGRKSVLEAPRAIEGFAGVWSARKGAARMVVLRLNDESLAIYSPVVGLTDDVQEAIHALGDVRRLIAPNAFHNLGQAEYLDAFPNSRMVAPQRALTRLGK